MKIIRNLFKPSQQETNEGSTAQEQAESDAPVTEASPETPATEAPCQGQDTPSHEARAESVEPQEAVQPEPEVFEPFVAAKKRIRAAHAGSDAFRSVLFFTTHKCASTFVTALLDELDAKSPYTNMNYEGAYWELGDEVEAAAVLIDEFLSQNSEMLFQKHGEIYGPIRKPIDFPSRKDFKHIFFFRDPRDVLVSMFYSFAYTHPEPPNSAKLAEFLELREEMREKGIDWFVLDFTERNFLPILLGYIEILHSVQNPLILKYDEFATETEVFLKKITDYLDIELSTESLATLTEFASPVRKGTPELAHKRSGKSGQWKHELKPETADKLNELLGPVLDNWGF